MIEPDMGLVEPFVRMLDDAAGPTSVRAIEAGGTWQPLWQAIVNSGYLDALVSEDGGGAGLTLGQIAPLIEALGAHALPLPVADTMVARALLARAGIAAPAGPIVLAASLAQPVTGALLADHALVDTGTALVLSPLVALNPEPTGVHGSSAAQLSGTPHGPVMDRPAGGLRATAAACRAALIAGAVARLTTMTTGYANDRVQFGKPIGRQQAVQHLLAVMAQDMIACRLAARLGAAWGMPVPPLCAASAKITTSIAAARVANSAHAVHGAIGISADFDLQLLTRRLHEWRLADGSEGYWSAVLGQARLGQALLGSDSTTIEWVRSQIFRDM